MIEAHELVLREAEFELSDEHAALYAAAGALLARSCPPEVGRAADPVGFSGAVWADLAAFRAVAMAVPVEAGGDGAGLVEAVLVAEQAGRHLAPVPLVEAIVGARVLAACPSEAQDGWLAPALAGEQVVTFVVPPPAAGRRWLVPTGSVADAVIGLDGHELVLLAAAERPPHVPNHARTPMAWVDPASGGTRRVLTSGPGAIALASGAAAELRLLTAAGLVGTGEACLELGLAQARERMAFGVPIGFFQGVSHRLVDAAIALTGASRLVRKAAWSNDAGTDDAPTLGAMAHVHAVRAATRAARDAIHVLGGVGFTEESDAPRCFRRITGAALSAGGVEPSLDLIADDLLRRAAS